MKYTESNPPIICMQTTSKCYKGTSKMTPKGVLWHSTGCNNPYIKRYVQPTTGASDEAEMIALLGKNSNKNDWNHVSRDAGLNFWVGKLADGTVAAVQTMPWNYKPWGCGGGTKGSANNTHIQFEICEDNWRDNKGNPTAAQIAYCKATFEEAAQVTAYLCKLYNLDPDGTVTVGKATVPVITSHKQSHDLGVGSNHGDPESWWKYVCGYTLDDVRNRVKAILNDTETEEPEIQNETKEVEYTVNMPTLEKGAGQVAGSDEERYVMIMQHLLLLKYPDCKLTTVDGGFGKNTYNAVLGFQKYAGLKNPDGVCGPNTWRALMEASVK